jgi:hypothetical protein
MKRSQGYFARKGRASLTRICIAGFETPLNVQNGKQIANWTSGVRERLMDESKKLRSFAVEQFENMRRAPGHVTDDSTKTSDMCCEQTESESIWSHWGDDDLLGHMESSSEHDYRFGVHFCDHE